MSYNALLCFKLNNSSIYLSRLFILTTLYCVPGRDASAASSGMKSGWMMWNFLVSGLACKCTLVLYDGSPLRDPAFLWTLVETLGITIFGTSAKYLDQLSVSIKKDLPCWSSSERIIRRKHTNLENITTCILLNKYIRQALRFLQHLTTTSIGTSTQTYSSVRSQVHSSLL